MSGETHALFVGSIPEVYDRHLGPLLFEPYARDLAARMTVGAGARVLEVACGTGRVTRHLREALPKGAQLVATDLNEPMLERARSSVPGAIDWRQADAGALPFDERTFDAVVCQFGVMFFPDKAEAMREAYRVLAPGGRYVFSVWDSLDANPWARIVDTTIAGFFEQDPPLFYRVPFGYHDVDALRSWLRTAGFADIEVDTVEKIAEGPSAEGAAEGFVRGNPVLTDIQERGTADVAEIEAAVGRALADRFGDSPLRFPMRAYVVTARRP